MGLFSSRPKWEKLARKAEKAESSSLWADALALYEDATAAAPAIEHEALTVSATRCRQALFDMHWAVASELAENEDFDGAEDRYVLAERFATDQEGRIATADAVRELTKRRLALEEAVEWDDTPVEDAPKAPEMTADEVFLIIAGTHPEEIGDQYQERDDAFRTAVIARDDGRHEEALPHLASLAADTSDILAAYECGLCLRALGRNDEALPLLQRAADAEPDWLQAVLAFVRAAWALENWDLAENTLQEAMDRTDEVDLAIYAAVVQTALLTEQPEYGIEAANEILERAPNERIILVMKGQLLELLGEQDKALAIYEGIVERTWQYDHEEERVIFDVASALLAVRIYLERRIKLERAEELVRATLAVTPPTQRWVYDIMLGEVLLVAGRDEESRETLEAASREIPDGEPVARMRVAELLGDTAEVARLEADLSDADRAAWDKRTRVI